MGCPPVLGDNPRALASGLSYTQVDKHGINILYHLHQCRLHAKVGKGGINMAIYQVKPVYVSHARMDGLHSLLSELCPLN